MYEMRVSSTYNRAAHRRVTAATLYIILMYMFTRLLSTTIRIILCYIMLYYTYMYTTTVVSRGPVAPVVSAPVPPRIGRLRLIIIIANVPVRPAAKHIHTHKVYTYRLYVVWWDIGK